MTKKLIVVGHGRGATSFAAQWLMWNDIKCKHEQMGPDGIVDSGLSIPDYPIRGGLAIGASRDEFDFKNKLTIIRNPWKTIATFAAAEVEGAIWAHGKYISLEEAEGNELAAIALSVVRWTQSALAYTRDQYIQAEAWNLLAPNWLTSHGFENREWKRIPVTGINHKPGHRMTRENIVARIPCKIAQEVKNFATEYGYVS